MSAGLGEAGSVTVVEFFDLYRREVVDRFGSSLVVEPVHPVEHRGLEMVAVAPGPVRPEQFGFEEADLGLGECVVVGVADGADGGVDAGRGEPVGERDRGVLAAGVGAS